ncbi:MAG: sugar transferase [Deltaproteobacteria bacterium]|nr:sugar transferase [Deltaproteobacteria bacterium]
MTYRLLGKRLLDFIVALLVFVLLLPLLLIIALIVWLDLGLPVLFSQRRIGLNEKSFVLYKFRTMHVAPKNSDQSPGISAIGQILRVSGLDELPQLFNIIKGDMSFVGPRPLLPEYLPLYNDEQKKRHLVCPGLTGLAQVSGRNSLTWPQKFAFDVQYVANLSLRLDFIILLKTFALVFSKPTTTALPEPFKGNLTDD